MEENDFAKLLENYMPTGRVLAEKERGENVPENWDRAKERTLKPSFRSFFDSILNKTPSEQEKQILELSVQERSTLVTFIRVAVRTLQDENRCVEILKFIATEKQIPTEQKEIMSKALSGAVMDPYSEERARPIFLKLPVEIIKTPIMGMLDNPDSAEYAMELIRSLPPNEIGRYLVVALKNDNQRQRAMKLLEEMPARTIAPYLVSALEDEAQRPWAFALIQKSPMEDIEKNLVGALKNNVIRPSALELLEGRIGEVDPWYLAAALGNDIQRPFVEELLLKKNPEDGVVGALKRCEQLRAKARSFRRV
ncbi:MAG: hypothetical protein Q7T16_03890 [Candidatus Burarchaeum sp.]|nr:hypothetical protein [Candidatus Burarchaeum sp.]MDO8339772.1 hypothetical protein [Candidatus Burarchaeum sp.]